MDKRYSIDLNNEIQLGKWLEKQKVGNEEKCGIRLDNRLVITIMRREGWLRELVFGKEV